MDPYRVSLALTYFHAKQDKYSLCELSELLGATSRQFGELLQELQEKEYIMYQDDLLTVTPRGNTYLIGSNQLDAQILNDDIVMPHIHKDQAFPIDAPYVPKRFFNKTDR